MSTWTRCTAVTGLAALCLLTSVSPAFSAQGISTRTAPDDGYESGAARGEFPAAADPSTTVSVRTTDGGAIGATAIFWGDAQGHDTDNPEVLGACDKQSDGLRSYAIVSWEDGDGWHVREVEDANGGGNGCVTRTLPNIADGTTVYFDACLKDGPDGAVRFCGSGTAVA